MLTEVKTVRRAIEKCSKCNSADIVKNGFSRHCNQRIKCKACGSCPVLDRKKSLDVDVNCLIRSFLERLSLCGVARVFAISYYQVYHQLNMTCLLLADFKTQVASCQADDIIELDELCGFCGRKANKQWLWAALSRHTRQIVAYIIGDRSRPDRVRRLSEDWYAKFLLSTYDVNLTATYGSLTRYFVVKEIINK